MVWSCSDEEPDKPCVTAAGRRDAAQERVTKGPPLTESFIHAQFNTHYIPYLKPALEIKISVSLILFLPRGVQRVHFPQSSGRNCSPKRKKVQDRKHAQVFTSSPV